jgi:hypothetical protein
MPAVIYILPPEENTQAREENAGLAVVATIIVQLRNWWRSLII